MRDLDTALNSACEGSSVMAQTAHTPGRVVFEQEGTFAALHACERFLTDRGFSFGSWQRGAPCAVMFGDYDISKWRNLSAAERAATHGQFSGDGRNGPIILVLTPAAPDEARAAIAKATGGAA